MTETKELQRANPVALAKASPSTIAQMLAAKPEFTDVEALHRLLDLQLRYDAESARREFNDAFAQFAADPPEVLKSNRVKAGDKGLVFFHEVLEDVADAVRPSLSALGLSWSWKTDCSGGKIKVTCILKHRSGHSEETSMESAPDMSGGKNSIQAIGSAVSYLERYTLKAILGFTPRGLDDDAKAAANKAPVAMPQARQESGSAHAAPIEGGTLYVREITSGASGKSIYATLSDGRKVSWFANQEGRDARMREALENGLPIRITTTTKGNYINLETVEIVYPEPGAEG